MSSLDELIELATAASTRRVLQRMDAAATPAAASTTTSAEAATPNDAAASPPGRLIVVANRLPITASKNEQTGAYAFKLSSGGLVSALVSVRSRLQFVWLGWLGQPIPERDQPAIREQLLAEHNCVPVFLPEDVAEAYYNGFCNDILWPLLHYEASGHAFDPALWGAYKRANAAFAEATLSAARPGDLVWVHDYHLMVLPAMLRRALGPAATIGWFLHTPFPSSEVFRTLPVRTELLRCLAACDLLGFHTWDYASHFLASASRLLAGAAVAPTAITLRGRTSRVGVFPIGIEPDAFLATARSPACAARLRELEGQFAGLRVIVSVDRLDPIKGMPHRLLGLDALFRKHPQWVGRVTLLQVAVPSRVDVETYQRLTAQVAGLIGGINGVFGSLSYSPVVYLYRSITPVELTALYALGDVALITSLRDGMNLVASEFVACGGEPCANRSAPGALVLSEFAGCAQSLAGAVLVNPWSPDDVAEGLHAALSMSAEERTRRWRHMHAYVTTFTSQRWALAYVAALQRAGVPEGGGGGGGGGAMTVAQARRHRLPRLQPGMVADAFRAALAGGEVARQGAPAVLLVLSLDDVLPALTGYGAGELSEDEELDLDPDESVKPSAVAAADTPVPGGAPEKLAGAPRQGAAPGPEGEEASSASPPPPRFLQRVLRVLAASPAVGVCVVSRREARGMLQRWFGDLPAVRCIVDGTLLRVPSRITPAPAPVLAGQPTAEGAPPAPPLTPPPEPTGAPLAELQELNQRTAGEAERASLLRALAPPAPAPVTAPNGEGQGQRQAGDGGVRWLAVAPGAVGGEPLPGPAQSAGEEGGSEEGEDWKPAVRAVLAYFTDRLPGSSVTETDNALMYDAGDACHPDIACWVLKEVTLHLSGTLANSPLTVTAEARGVTVRWGEAPTEALLRAAVRSFGTTVGGTPLVLTIGGASQSFSEAVAQLAGEGGGGAGTGPRVFNAVLAGPGGWEASSRAAARPAEYLCEGGAELRGLLLHLAGLAARRPQQA